MSTDTAFAKRSREENWLPILELATREVFEIMLACKVKPVAQSEGKPNAGFTAMVGLAGALCGVVTVCCDAKTAGLIAKACWEKLPKAKNRWGTRSENSAT